LVVLSRTPEATNGEVATRAPRPANRLLALLPAAEYRRLSANLQPVSLPVKQVLYKARGTIDYVYFPTRGVVSAMAIMADGSAIELATIGREGMAGLAAFVGRRSSPYEAMVQVGGEGLRMRADAFRREVGQDGPLRRLLVLYHEAFSTQVSYAVACNGFHTVQKRCCRWLLMTHDRAGADELPLTHEFLAIMLGVRRPSVTEVLRPLQERGLIRNRRAKPLIADRAGLKAESCECHRIVQDEFARLFG
jgi:CRP-like cAMP-binding protein